MSNNTSSSSSGGNSFTDFLTIVFIVLKLTHVIDWSWWWVLSPIWLSILGVALVAGLALLVYGAYRKIKEK